MTVNLYNTGVSGLNAAQSQLATTGHNIANVNTEGYHRQRAEQINTVGNFSNGNFIGNGTYVTDISRVFSDFTYREQLITGNQSSYSQKFNNQLTQLDSTMSTYGGRLSGSIDSFYKSLHSIADKPNDTTLRSMALDQATTLAADFNSMNENFETMERAQEIEIEEITNRINVIATEISKANEQIASNVKGGSAGQPNDLLDHRNKLIGELNTYVKVNTLEDANGLMSVFIGSGTTLVAGVTPLSLDVQLGSADPKDTSIVLKGPNSVFALKSDEIGGELGAIMSYRDGAFRQARREIDLVAMGISEVLNNAQAEGLDLDGLQGIDIFSDINTAFAMQSRVFADNENTGDLSAQVKVHDISLVPPSEILIEYDGTNYSLTNLSSGQQVSPLTELSTGVFDTPYGFTFEEVAGTPSAGDTFVIKPTQNGAVNFEVTLHDPSKIAASSAIGITPSDDNVSNGDIKITNMLDPEAAKNYASTTFPSVIVDVWESAAGTFDYRIYDSANPPPASTIASGNYSTGSSAVIDLPPLPATAAFQLEISGDHGGEGTNARETFVIGDVFAEGNGNNMLDMADTQNNKTLANGDKSFAQALSSNISSVGSAAASAEVIAETQFAMSEQATSRHQAASGVNLDEEAANMLQFQKAYQASAKIIDVANTIFDTILSSIR